MKISVSVKPNSRTEGIESAGDHTLIVRVRVQPENGKANQRVCELLAEHFQVPKSQVVLISGPKSKKKVFQVGV